MLSFFASYVPFGNLMYHSVDLEVISLCGQDIFLLLTLCWLRILDLDFIKVIFVSSEVQSHIILNNFVVGFVFVTCCFACWALEHWIHYLDALLIFICSFGVSGSTDCSLLDLVIVIHFILSPMIICWYFNSLELSESFAIQSSSTVHRPRQSSMGQYVTRKEKKVQVCER